MRVERRDSMTREAREWPRRIPGRPFRNESARARGAETTLGSRSRREARRCKSPSQVPKMAEPTMKSAGDDARRGDRDGAKADVREVRARSNPEPRHAPNSVKNPGAHRHGRLRFENAQHVEKEMRPAEIHDEKNGGKDRADARRSTWRARAQIELVKNDPAQRDDRRHSAQAADKKIEREFPRSRPAV